MGCEVRHVMCGCGLLSKVGISIGECGCGRRMDLECGAGYDVWVGSPGRCGGGGRHGQKLKIRDWFG